MRRIYPIGLFLILLCLGAWSQAPARDVLLLYKSSEEATPSLGRLGQKVQPILEGLGYRTRFHDIDSGWIDPGKATAIVSWFASPKMADPEGYVDWLAAQTAAGRKIIILGNFGAHTSDGTTWMTNDSLNRFFYPFGLSYAAAYTGDPKLLTVTQQKAPATAPTPLSYYLLFRSVNPKNDIDLAVKRSDLADSESALVVRTPYGGMAQETYVDHLDLKAFIASILAADTVTTKPAQKLLGLYKSSESVDAHNNFLARFAAAPLYDLGYAVDYWDIEKGLPSPEAMKAYVGIVSWYQTPEMPNADEYVDWLAQQVQDRRKVVVLGNFGAFAEDIPSKGGTVRRFLQSPEYNRFFYPFGLEFRGAWTPDRSEVAVVKKETSMMTWLEPGHVGHYYWIRSVNPDNQVYLSVNRKALSDGESSVVVSTPAGGLALESYILSTDPATQQPRLRLDLQKFLKVSLESTAGTPQGPAPAAFDVQKNARPALPPLGQVAVGGQKPYPAGVQPIRRKVLCFYQRSMNESPTENQVYINAEVILDHLGLVTEYRAIEDPLPSDTEMESYRGVILWLSKGVIPRAKAFDSWFQNQMKAGRYGVVLGGYDLRDDADLSSVDPTAAYALMGLDFDPLGSSPTLSQRGFSGFKGVAPADASVVFEEPLTMGFERALDWNDKDLHTGWHLVRAKNPDVQVKLTVKRREGLSDVVDITPTGGVVVGPFAMHDTAQERVKLTESVRPDADQGAVAEELGGEAWRLDPFRFFSQALRVDKMAKPDVTTLNGNRIYFSHIDGDAFGGMSLIDRSSLNGEMMLREVLKPLGLPITVSFVTVDIAKRLDPKYSRELKTAQEILALPNVEPASHTFTHPFDWMRGDLAVSDATPDKVRLVRKDIDLKKELDDSVDFIDALCPPEKRCQILLWSGRCNPPAEALSMVRQEGLPNLNGGESVFDQTHPYIAGLKPLFGRTGDEIQYHVSAAGDFYYTSSWTRNYDGMKNLVDFFSKTETPRRLRAMNVYYHFYLAERQLGIDGLQAAYDYVRKQPIAPMFASEYVEILADSLRTQLGQTEDGATWVSNSGDLRTIRFDEEPRFLDLEKSRGVLGYSHLNGNLYVHLDGQGEARIALSLSPPSQVYFERFSHRTQKVKIAPDDVSFIAEGQGPAELVLKNLSPNQPYQIQVGAESTDVVTDAQGQLVWKGRLAGYHKTTPFRIRKETP